MTQSEQAERKDEPLDQRDDTINNQLEATATPLHQAGLKNKATIRILETQFEVKTTLLQQAELKNEATTTQLQQAEQNTETINNRLEVTTNQLHQAERKNGVTLNPHLDKQCVENTVKDLELAEVNRDFVRVGHINTDDVRIPT